MHNYYAEAQNLEQDTYLSCNERKLVTIKDKKLP